MHYGQPPIMTALREQVADGWVVCASASAAMRQAHLCQEANMPFWLQLVGTGITTTWALHLGAVCTHAQWPAVTCMNMYVDQLIKEPIEVKAGFARVPESPGLGIEFNEASLKWKVASSSKPNADAIHAIVRPNGDRVWYESEFLPQGYWHQSLAGNIPVCERGVKLEQWTNDGSKEWKDLAARVKIAPVRAGS
jgi:galactonate dehydratase